MEVHHDILLLRTLVPRSGIPSILHVCCPSTHTEPSLPDSTRGKGSSADSATSMRYSRLLEENSFSNRRADYIYLLALCAGFLLVRMSAPDTPARVVDKAQGAAQILTLPFLSSSLAFSLVYIWSRRNPSIKMSLFGVITYVTSAIVSIFLPSYDRGPSG